MNYVLAGCSCALGRCNRIATCWLGVATCWLGVATCWLGVAYISNGCTNCLVAGGKIDGLFISGGLQLKN